MLKKLRFYYSHLHRIGLAQGLKQISHELRRRMIRPVSLRSFPNSLHIEISNTCNLSCEYCILKNKLPGNKTMSLETFNLLKPYVKYVRGISLSGLAEPLLNRNLITILHEIKNISPDCQVSILSNATLLTEDLCVKLVDEKLDYFGFSLDGIDDSTDEIRKGGKLSSVLTNIQMLNNIKSLKKSSVPIICATTVLQKKNYRQLPDIVSLAASLGVSRLDVNGLEPYSEGMVGNELWSSPLLNEDLTMILSQAAHCADKNRMDLHLAGMVPGPAICPSVATPIILANGDVVPCAALAYSRDYYFTVKQNGEIAREHNTSEPICFGNIHERDISVIWASPEYTLFRSQVLSGQFPPGCRTCLIKHGIICVREAVTASEVIKQIASLAVTGNKK